MAAVVCWRPHQLSQDLKRFGPFAGLRLLQDWLPNWLPTLECTLEWGANWGDRSGRLQRHMRATGVALLSSSAYFRPFQALRVTAA